MPPFEFGHDRFGGFDNLGDLADSMDQAFPGFGDRSHPSDDFFGGPMQLGQPLGLLSNHPDNLFPPSSFRDHHRDHASGGPFDGPIGSQFGPPPGMFDIAPDRFITPPVQRDRCHGSSLGFSRSASIT
jgi:hypothetical protein